MLLDLRGATAVGLPNIRYMIVHIPHLLPARVMVDTDNSPNSTIRIELGRKPT